MTLTLVSIALAVVPVQSAPQTVATQLDDGRPTHSRGAISAPEKSPKAPDGFVVELVLHHPDVKWPSAVHALEDGSLLVAEDPMDMPGPTDQPIDRIWRLRFEPDGTFTKTLFAEQLYAVMGLQEIDGAVYVMNMPHLTMLRDRDGDGVAEERQEILTTLGPPAPGWPGGFNDHVVSGIRLGMDGLLYVSVGDKGIPLAAGRDGTRITLRGGGVVRLAPDATRLEVVASGTRNHLDVAMDERDHVFTYDNTDDGLGWWTRLSEIMLGGYYGYPWDYQHHPERFLPCMKDDGGGSPVGGLVYREDAWPEEYRGDLFFCEWADQVIRRFEVEPAGGSFRCTKTEDFVTAGTAEEFRPLDVCESADGRYLFVADWNHPGWQSPQVAGRVWRIRRADDRPGAPPLADLADGTMASRERASIEGLLENLAHPSHRRRLAAQRELARRARADPAVATQLPEQLSSRLVALGRAGDDARVARERSAIHLLWALLAASEKLPTLLAADALGSPSAAVREQTARALGQIGVLDPAIVKTLADLAQHDPDLLARREATIALGRARDARTIFFLLRAIDATEDRFVRFAIRRAIRAMDGPWEILLDRLVPRCSAAAREEFWLAMREHYELGWCRALAKWTRDPIYSPALRARVIREVAELHRKRPDWDGKWWQIQPAKSGWPAKTEKWDGTPLVIEALCAAFDQESDEVRAAVLDAVRIAPEPELFERVRARFEQAAEESERAELIELLGDVRDPDAIAIFERGLASESAATRLAAVRALVRVRGAEALRALESRLADPDASVQAAAVEAFAAHPSASRLGVYLRGLELGGETREKCRAAIATLRAEIRPALEDLAARGDLPDDTLALLRELYDEPPPILRWQLAGPFARATRDARLEAGEPALDVTWRAIEAAPPHGFVDLGAALSRDGQVSAYALATIESPLARRARCLVGSDDGVWVWLNGRLVHEDPSERGWAPDQDRFEIDLVQGTNTLLLRIDQGGGDWAFNVKVSDVLHGPLFEGARAPDANGTNAPGAGERPPFDAAIWREHALANPGDAARGKQLFFAEEGPGCAKCHAIAGVGPKLGPDLRDVGKKYAREELVTSILDPSQRILEGYTATNVFLASGDVLSGLVVAEKDGVLSLADAQGDVRELPLADVTEKRASKLSAMPAGLAETLTPQQLADLVAWLETLKE